MKAAIYARFSCSKQREASIEDQLRVCEDWCQDNWHTVVERYCDRAISGRTDDRPEFQRMISEANRFDIVVVYMMDRFSRDPYDAPYYKRILRDHGVRVVSATEPMAEGAEALLLEKIYEGLAAVESEHISKRTRRGMEGNALKLMHNGVRVFGYKFASDNSYEIDEEAAPLVVEVFERKLSGENAYSIATDLANRGVRTYTGRPCSHSMVCNILKNEKYTGVYKWGDVRVEGGMPQIIDRQTFDAVQNIKPRRRSMHEYILSGRTVHKCGHNMIGMSAHGHGGNYYYYRCRDCGDSLRSDILELEIVKRIRMLLDDRTAALELAERAVEYMSNGDVAKKKEKALKRQREAKAAINRLVALAEIGDVPEITEAIKRQKEIYAAAGAEAASYDLGISVEDFADFLQFGSTLEDRQLLDAFVFQVLVEDDVVTVILNYDLKNKPATIELQRVCLSSDWLPVFCKNQTKFGFLQNHIFIRFARAA